MDISGVWGYGAVVIQRAGEWQGFVILDPDEPTLVPAVREVLEAASKAASAGTPGLEVTGILSSAVLGAFVWGPDRIVTPASALSKHLGERFWIVDVLGEPDVAGIRTEVSILDVRTPEEARDEINSRGRLLKMVNAVRQSEAR